MLELIQTHPSLSTVITGTRAIKQSVKSSNDVKITYLDYSDDPSASRLACFIRTELSTRIDPRTSPIRISLVRHSQSKHTLIINVHHIVTDLVSSSIILEDLAKILDGKSITQKLSWDYATFCRWQRANLDSNSFHRQQNYWYERLAGMSPMATPLAEDRFDRKGSIGLIEEMLPLETKNQIDELATETKSSIFAVLLATLFTMAIEQTGEKDVAVASLFSNRTLPQLQRTVGFFVNVLILRVIVKNSTNFRSLIKLCQKAIGGALNNADIPFQALSPPPPRMKLRDNARVDDMVFHVSSNRIDTEVHGESYKLQALVPEVIGRFDLELAVRPALQGFVVRLSYNTSRLSDVAARQFINDYVSTTVSMMDNKDSILL